MFTPGHKLSKGRPKGVPNKRTQYAQEILEKAGFCPITAMMDTYHISMTIFKEELEKLSTGRTSPLECEAAKYLKTAADMASDLASYSYPRLKSVEQTRSSPFEGMSNQEKLEAMKQMVTLLEAQVAKSLEQSDGSSPL